MRKADSMGIGAALLPALQGGEKMRWYWAIFVLTLSVALAANLPAANAAAESDACPHDASKVFAQASPAVVFISAIAINPYELAARVDTAIGSDFVFSDEGLIFTNAHVVFGRQAIAVTFHDGESLPAAVVGMDPILDLAVLRLLENRKTLSVLEIPQEYAYSVGQAE